MTEKQEWIQREPVTGDEEEWLSNELSTVGFLAGGIAGFLLLPWFHFFRSSTIATVWLFLTIFVGYLVGKRLAHRVVNAHTFIRGYKLIRCSFGKHYWCGPFTESKIECLRCGYRPDGHSPEYYPANQ